MGSHFFRLSIPLRQVVNLLISHTRQPGCAYPLLRHEHCPASSARSKGLKRPPSGCQDNPITEIENNKETMMRNEIKIVEDGVIFELEIEEVEEVVAPTVIVAG